MSIQFIDRRCAVNVLPTSNGYSFEYGGKIHKSRTEKEVHSFFLKEYSSNRLETVKLRFAGKKYYLHFTLDKPEKFSSKRALRSILAQENEGAWIEEKNGKQRYFVDEGWLLSRVREVSKDEFDTHQSSSLMQKVAQLALGVLSLSHLSTQASSILSCYTSGLSMLGFSLLQASPALAQMPAFGEFRINTNTTKYVPTTSAAGNYARSSPKVIGLLDGGFVAGWASYNQDGFYHGVFGQIYDTIGVPKETEFQINTNSTNDQYALALAALKNGGFVAVWASFQNGVDWDIYAQMFSSVRFPIGSTFRVNDETINHQYYPVVATLSDGSFVIVWQSDQNGIDNDIYGKIYNATGFSIRPEFRINTNTTNNQQVPSVAALIGGGFIVAWQSDQSGIDNDIYGKIHNATGFSIRPEFRINTNTTNQQEFPSLMMLMDGGFIVIWESLQNGADYDIYAQICSALGFLVGSEFRINNFTISHQQRSVPALLANGDFAVIWESLGQDGDGWGIYCQRFNASWISIGSEFRINDNTTNHQVNPTIAALINEGFIVAWGSLQNGIDSDIYGKRYDSSGSPVINQSFSAASTLALSSVSSSTINSLTISSSGSAPTSSSSARASSLSQTSSFLYSSSFSQSYPVILSITEISYGTSNLIIANGVNVGTFVISGGTGLVSGGLSNTLTIYLNPDIDSQGTFSLFSIPQGQEGQFQTLELVGESCQSFEGSTATDNSGQVVYQVIYQMSTCTTTGARPIPALFSNMLKV